MCTAIVKIRGDKLLRLQGIGCCVRVETVTDFAPEISNENGWHEVFVDTQFPELKTIEVRLDDRASSALAGKLPAFELTYRNRTVHFRDREQLEETIRYIESKSRKAVSFMGDRSSRASRRHS
jgi:hypothetical protein